MGLDIGPRTVEEFARTIADAKTILWNGPMGVFELEPFSAGTRGVAKAVAATGAFTRGGRRRQPSPRCGAGLEDAFDHLSTGGGASLEFLEGGDSPASPCSGGGLTMTERRPIIAANWKMHKTHLEAIQAVQKLSYLVDKDDAERVEVVICPPFTALRVGADPDRRRPARRSGSARRTSPGGEGRVHRRDIAADARGAQGAAT